MLGALFTLVLPEGVHMRLRSRTLTLVLALSLPGLFSATAFALDDSAGTKSLSSNWSYPSDGATHTAANGRSDELSFTITLAQGEVRYFSGSANAEATGTFNDNVSFGAGVDCSLGSTRYRGLWSSKNWRGTDEDSTGVTLLVRYIFTAPTTGTFVCRMKVTSASDYGAPQMRLSYGPTWLDMSETESGAGSESPTSQSTLAVGDSEHVLDYTWSAETSGPTKFVIGLADVQINTLGTGTVALDSRLSVSRLAVSGYSCTQATKYYPSSTSYQRDNVTSAQHHAKIHQTSAGYSTGNTNWVSNHIVVDLLNDVNCSNQFRIKLLLKVVSGYSIETQTATSYQNVWDDYSVAIGLSRTHPPVI